MSLFPIVRVIALAGAVVLSAVVAPGAPAVAQQGPPGATPDDLLLMYFYKDPRPERLVGLVERTQARNLPWNGYVAMTGLLSVVFRTHPGSIEKLIPAQPNDKSAEAVSAALALAGQRAMLDKLGARLAAAGSDAALKAELAGLPDAPEKVVIRTPTHLDLVWGMFFATGDQRFPTMIANFLAQTADRSDAIAIDIAKTVVALTGGPQEIMKELRGKYGDQGARDVIVAASALWALGSNARQHPPVAAAAETYVQAHAGSQTSKAMTALVLRRQQPQPN
jgi:hypothetical protein